MAVRLFALAAVISLAPSCAGVDGPGVAPDDLTRLLWLPPEATLEEDPATPVRIVNGRSVYADGSASVAFTIEAQPSDLTDRIMERVASLGLEQRRTQYLNPWLATSFAGGWQVLGGGTMLNPSQATRRSPYRRWRGEWEDGLGNILVYDIGGQDRALRVLASYIPRPVVESSLRKVGR